MARKCPACGAMNDDELGFCNKCGEPIAPGVRLAMEIKQFEKAAKAKPAPSNPQPQRSRSDDDEDLNLTVEQPEKKSVLPWILLGVAAVVVVAVLLIL